MLLGTNTRRARLMPPPLTLPLTPALTSPLTSPLMRFERGEKLPSCGERCGGGVLSPPTRGPPPPNEPPLLGPCEARLPLFDAVALGLLREPFALLF